MHSQWGLPPSLDDTALPTTWRKEEEEEEIETHHLYHAIHLGNPNKGGRKSVLSCHPRRQRDKRTASPNHTHAKQQGGRKEGNQIKEEKTNLYLCLAAMQRMWSSNVKVADRRGCREEEAEEEEEVVAPAADEEAPWGLCTVTCRQRESSLSVTTWNEFHKDRCNYNVVKFLDFVVIFFRCNYNVVITTKWLFCCEILNLIYFKKLESGKALVLSLFYQTTINLHYKPFPLSNFLK